MRPWPLLGSAACATRERTLKLGTEALGGATVEADGGHGDEGARHDDAAVGVAVGAGAGSLQCRTTGRVNA